jgi:type VI secretion system secreted protein VgrG
LAPKQETIAAALVGGGLDDAALLRAEVVEALDAPTRAVVRLASHAEIDLEAPIGAEVTLEVSLDADVRRRFHLVVLGLTFEGVVASKDGEAPQLIYSAELAHPIAMLRLRRDVRMFQAMDAVAIVKDVLTRAPVPFEASFAVQRTLHTRDVCVQYRESDFDFVSRLCEFEGVFYRCDDEGDAAKVVFADAAAAFSPVAEEGAVPLRDTANFGSGVWDLWSFTEAVPDQTTVLDYDFEKPNLQIEATAPISDAVVTDWLDFPGGAPDPDHAQALAEIRAQGFAGRKSQAEGHGDRLSFRAGGTFELDDGASTEWLLTRVEHTIVPRHDGSADDSGYRNRFVARPKEASYRPERRTPAPVARGTQSVVVTGPAGEEIHTDDLGRLKAKFFWDRQGTDDDKSSFWLRMAQLPISGSMALARMGWEIAVVHLHGDPNQPVAVARLYNAEKPSPYAYP